MTGLIYAVAPLIAAISVARREPAHRPVALALGASALYSVAALPTVASHLDPRALLGLFALVAVASGGAYVCVFGWRWSDERVELAGALVGAALFIAYVSPASWDLATWGPFVVSSIVGGLAAWAWRSRIAVTTLTQRCALVLLASDVCMLVFVRWPGVQAWQGRVAAVAVTVVQVAWLIRRETPSAP